jgi:hypothetical protein
MTAGRAPVAAAHAAASNWTRDAAFTRRVRAGDACDINHDGLPDADEVAAFVTSLLESQRL